MNKGAIQRFAIWERNELIAQVSQRAYQYGITKEGCGEANGVTVGGRALTGDEQKQRRHRVERHDEILHFLRPLFSVCAGKRPFPALSALC